METTDEPYEVVVTPYKTTMLADGKDAAVINISVVDKQGREVPTANNLIKFRLAGDARPEDLVGRGKIIGVGNGDPSCHEPDKYFDDSSWQRSLFNGKCQVIIQAGKHNDIIKFEALSEGLQKGSTGIHTIHTTSPQVVARNRITSS